MLPGGKAVASLLSAPRCRPHRSRGARMPSRRSGVHRGSRLGMPLPFNAMPIWTFGQLPASVAIPSRSTLPWTSTSALWRM